MMHLSSLLAALSISCLCVYRIINVLSYRAQLRRHGCVEPPHYPHKDPILGLDLFAGMMNALKRGRFLDFKKEQFVTHGRTFRGNAIGINAYYTSDPEVSKAVHATYAAKFGLQPLRYEVAKHLWGNGIIVTDGEHWQRGRALIRASFDVVHIANFDRLRKHTKTFLELLPSDGTTVNLMPLFKRLILDTTSDFIFGEAMGALTESHSCDKFMDAFAYAQKGTAIRATLGALKFLHRDKRWWEACKYITDFVDVHVERALEESEKNTRIATIENRHRLRLLDEMARETKDRLTLRSMAINVFSPAHDGAAVALSNALFHIVRNPSIWAKLRKEVDADTDRELTYDTLNSYKYLGWVLRETHRLTPIVTLNQRICLESTALPFGGGFEGKDPLYVPKGSLFELNYRAMCHDASFWGPDVSSFLPERWEHIRPGWEYTPFGGGPRICPGQRLVFVESAYVLVMLLRQFKEVENRDCEMEWKEEMRMTFQSKNGCLVGLIPK